MMTLDYDEDGIWLIEMTPEGPYQLGHIPWDIIAKYIKEHMSNG